MLFWHVLRCSGMFWYVLYLNDSVCNDSIREHSAQHDREEEHGDTDRVAERDSQRQISSLLRLPATPESETSCETITKNGSAKDQDLDLSETPLITSNDCSLSCPINARAQFTMLYCSQTLQQWLIQKYLSIIASNDKEISRRSESYFLLKKLKIRNLKSMWSLLGAIKSCSFLSCTGSPKLNLVTMIYLFHRFHQPWSIKQSFFVVAVFYSILCLCLSSFRRIKMNRIGSSLFLSSCRITERLWHPLGSYYSSKWSPIEWFPHPVGNDLKLNGPHALLNKVVSIQVNSSHTLQEVVSSWASRWGGRV